MTRFFTSVTVWAVLGFAALFLLQWFPGTGVYLMFFGVASLCGAMLHLVVLAPVCDVFTGKFPKIMLAVPVLAYGGYYGLYFKQQHDIESRVSELKHSNPSLLVQFDAAKYDLVTEETGLVTRFKVPVIYSRNPNVVPENFRSHRLVTQESCAAVKEDTLSRVQKFYPESKVLGEGRSKPEIRHCMLSAPEAPKKSIIEVKTANAEIWKHKASAVETVYVVLKDGKQVGEYRQAFVYRYHMFPMPTVGCFLNSSRARWDCFAEFGKSFEVLDTSPLPPEAGPIRLEPAALMLGLTPFTRNELVNYQGWNEHKEVLSRLAQESDRVDESAFASLDDLISNLKAEVPWRMAYLLSRNQELAVKNADRMVQLFGVLLGPQGANYYAADEKLEEVATALANLPESTFAQQSAKIKALVGDNHLLDISLLLYVRLADHNRQFSAQYQTDLQQQATWTKFAPPLAICRQGMASAEVRQLLKDKFRDASYGQNQDRHFQEALFVALLAVGETDFTEAELPKLKSPASAWFKKVFDDHKSKGGMPNNCMPRDWPATDYVSPELLGWVK